MTFDDILLNHLLDGYYSINHFNPFIYKVFGASGFSPGFGLVMTIMKKVSLEENISKMAKCSLHDLVKSFCSMFNVVVYVNARTCSVMLSCHGQIGQIGNGWLFMLG